MMYSYLPSRFKAGLLTALLIAFHSHAYTIGANILPGKFTDSLISEGTGTAEKLRLIDAFKSEGMILDTQNAHRLLEYIPKSDTELLTPLLDFMASISSQGCDIDISYAERELTPLLDRFAVNHEYDNFRKALAVLAIIYQNDASIEDKDPHVFINLLLFRQLNKNGHGLLDFYLSRHPAELPNLGLFINSLGKEIADYYLKALSSANAALKLRLLNYIRGSEVVYLIGKDNLKQFIDLSQSDSAELRNVAGSIMSLVTHQKNVNDWGKWWEENASTLDMVDLALTSLADEKKNSTDRIFAGRQLGYAFLFGRKDLNIIKSFETIVLNPAIQLDIRVECFKLINFVSVNIRNFKAITPGMDTVESHVFASELRCILDFILEDARTHDLLCLLPREFVLDKEVQTKLFTILDNRQMNRRSRGAAAYALGHAVEKRKEYAQAVMQFLEEGLPGREPDISDNRALLALMALTRKDNIGFDPQEWRKAVSEMPDDPPDVKQ